MKKRLLIILMLIFITGCSSQYNLKIDGETLKEEISFNIDKNKVVEEEMGPETSIYSKESIKYLKNDDLYPVINNNKEKYEKEITEDNNYINVKLNYNYTIENYGKSQILSNCFEKIDVRETKKEIYIHLSGKFKCLKETNNLDFVIESNNRVLYNNADNKASKRYVWNINSSNVDNIDIEIKLNKQSLFQYYLFIAVAVVVILILIVFAINVYSKIKNRANVNEV